MVLYGEGVLTYEVLDSVAVITMNRPERMNALSPELHDRIVSAFKRFDSDDTAQVAILTGAGDRAFSAGGDLKHMAENKIGNITDAMESMNGPYPSATYDWEVSKPLIAAVNGFALAGGFCLALRCDLRVASTNAEFGIAEAKVGRAAPWGVPLMWEIPGAVAREMLFTGDRISAQRAYEIGFVNRVCAPEELMPTTLELARTIAANAPLTVRAHKRIAYRATDVGRTNAAMLADEYCREVYASEDCQEGQRAFAEKRAPVWQGR